MDKIMDALLKEQDELWKGVVDALSWETRRQTARSEWLAVELARAKVCRRRAGCRKEPGCAECPACWHRGADEAVDAMDAKREAEQEARRWTAEMEAAGGSIAWSARPEDEQDGPRPVPVPVPVPVPCGDGDG